MNRAKDRRPTTAHHGSVFLIVFAGVCGLWAFQPDFDATAETPCLVMSRAISADYYKPGQELTIEITLTEDCGDAVTSLGIQETLPEQWQYVTGETVTGTPPAQWPAPGSAGTLEIFWISVNALPITLRYTARAPESASGAVMFTGHAMFSIASGDLQESNMAQTTLPLYGVEEGEGESAEGEGEASEGESEGETREGEEGETSVDGEGDPEAETPVDGEAEAEGESAEGEGEDGGAAAGCCRREKNGPIGNTSKTGDGLLLFAGLVVLSPPFRSRVNRFRGR